MMPITRAIAIFISPVLSVIEVYSDLDAAQWAQSWGQHYCCLSLCPIWADNASVECDITYKSESQKSRSLEPRGT